MPAPRWTHALLDQWADAAATGVLSFKYRGGRIPRAMPRGPVIEAPPGDGERLNAKVPPPCPQCTRPLTLRDDGRKISCAWCEVTWTLADYRAEIKKVLMSKSGRK